MDTNNMKFLIVDDDAAERSLTIQALGSQFADVDIIEIGSPEDFNGIMAQADFDLVITEFRLAWTDGLSLFREIHNRYACIPVIMLTGSCSETLAVTAIKNGMADYIVKNNRHSLAHAIEQSLPESGKKNPSEDKGNNMLLCAKWELATSRLAPDSAHSMRISPNTERGVEPFKRMINNPGTEPTDDSHPVLRNDGKDGGLLWNDSTYRCEIQDLLSRNKVKLHAIFNNVSDGVIIIDKHGITESLNPSAERIFGYRQAELIGLNINRLIPDADRSRHDSYLNHYLTGGAAKKTDAELEIYGLRKDGSTFPMNWNISKICVDDHHLFITTVHDVSKHKQAEDTLRKLSSLLTALKIDLSWLSKHLPADLQTCREKTATITRHVDGIIQSIRKIMTDLQPSILDHLGLLAAIGWHIEKFRRETGMECILTVPDNAIEIDEKRSMAIFRILQEALNNIVLHAKASKASIEVSVVDDIFLMHIGDNGCGMTQAQMSKTGRYGIKGMCERARFFDGELTLDGRPGQGVLLNLRMPLQSSQTGGRHD